MTDAEINLAIAKIEYPDRDWLLHKNGNIAHGYDYCKYWSDIGPIIERERIDVITMGLHKWVAMREVKAEAETPTKAAALCYLKMKES